MRKSRILSLLLAVVFIMTTVTIPAFADVTYVNGDPNAIIGLGDLFAPIGNLPFHISYKIDNDDATYAMSASKTGVTVGATDGILNITSAASVGFSTYGSNTINANVNITIPDADPVAGSSIAYIYSGFNYTFEPGSIGSAVVPGHSARKMISESTTNMITSDGDGNYYYASNPVNTNNSTKTKFTIGAESLFNHIRWGSGNGVAPFVVEMDIAGLREDVALRKSNSIVPALTFLNLNSSYKIDNAWATSANAVPSFDFANFNPNDGKWHNYKWVITPSSDFTATFDLYIDNQFAMNDYKVSFADYSADTSLSFRILAIGLDNFKRYGTSLGFPYDVKVNCSNNEIGEEITASALKASMPTSNIPETLEYNFVISDSVNGDYEYLAPGTSSYVLKEEDAGKYIRVAARVKETAYDECVGEWVYSDYLRVAIDPYIYGDPIETIKTAQIVAPLPGMPLRIAHTSSDPEASYALGKTTPGMSVSDNGILTITSDVASFTEPAQETTVNDKVTITLADGTKVAGPQINVVNSSYNFTFEDDILATDSSAAYVGGSNDRPALSNVSIVTDETGRKYGKWSKNNYISGKGEAALLARKESVSPFVWEWEMLDLRYDVPVGTTKILCLTDNYKINTTWLDSLPATAEVNPKFNLNSFSSAGWHKYKYVITPTTYTLNGVTVLPHFDIYIDNMLLVKNVPMTGVGADGSWQIGTAASNYNLQWYAKGVDNYKRYGTSLGFAHDVNFTGDATVGSTITLNAEKAKMPLYNIPESLEKAIFVADSAGAQYTLVEESIGNTFTLTEEFAGKYIKVAARVKEDIAGGVATEWVLSNDATFVPDSAISSITLKVDGADADINAVNLAGKTEAQIDITITAASSVNKGAKFILAQYAEVNDKKVLVGAALNNADLTAEANAFDLSLKAANIDADTTFRLFILTSNGLVPVKDIVLK